MEVLLWQIEGIASCTHYTPEQLRLPFHTWKHRMHMNTSLLLVRFATVLIFLIWACWQNIRTEYVLVQTSMYWVCSSMYHVCSSGAWQEVISKLPHSTISLTVYRMLWAFSKFRHPPGRDHPCHCPDLQDAAFLKILYGLSQEKHILCTYWVCTEYMPWHTQFVPVCTQYVLSTYWVQGYAQGIPDFDVTVT